MDIYRILGTVQVRYSGKETNFCVKNMKRQPLSLLTKAQNCRVCVNLISQFILVYTILRIKYVATEFILTVERIKVFKVFFWTMKHSNHGDNHRRPAYIIQEERDTGTFLQLLQLMVCTSITSRMMSIRRLGVSSFIRDSFSASCTRNRDQKTIKIWKWLFPDPGSRISDPGSQPHIFEGLVIIFWVKTSIILGKLGQIFFFSISKIK